MPKRMRDLRGRLAAAGLALALLAGCAAGPQPASTAAPSPAAPNAQTPEAAAFGEMEQATPGLRAMGEGVYLAVRAPMTVPLDTTYRLRHQPCELERAYHALQGKSLLKRTPKAEQFEPLTAAPIVSVASRIIHVLRGLVTGRVKTLRQLFSKDATRSQTVATFLAVLELVRAGRVNIDAHENLSVKQRRKGA